MSLYNYTIFIKKNIHYLHSQKKLTLKIWIYHKLLVFKLRWVYLNVVIVIANVQYSLVNNHC